MALVNCPECKVEVSDKAHSCPKCGCPITKEVKTIEQTGKKYKGQILLSIGLMIIGFIVGGCGGVGIGALLFLGGAIWLLISILMSWWHHG